MKLFRLILLSFTAATCSISNIDASCGKQHFPKNRNHFPKNWAAFRTKEPKRMTCQESKNSEKVRKQKKDHLCQNINAEKQLSDGHTAKLSNVIKAGLENTLQTKQQNLLKRFTAAQSRVAAPETDAKSDQGDYESKSTEETQENLEIDQTAKNNNITKNVPVCWEDEAE